MTPAHWHSSQVHWLVLTCIGVDHRWCRPAPFPADEETEAQRQRGACPGHTGRQRQSQNSSPTITAPCLLNILFLLVIFFHQALVYIIGLFNMAIEVGVETVMNMVSHCVNRMFTKVRSHHYCSALSNQESRACVWKAESGTTCVGPACRPQKPSSGWHTLMTVPWPSPALSRPLSLSVLDVLNHCS